jgi:hypothetical protein
MSAYFRVMYRVLISDIVFPMMQRRNKLWKAANNMFLNACTLVWRRCGIQLYHKYTVVKATGISLQVFTVHVLHMCRLLVLLLQL